jgi:hypothetical protein
VLIASLCSAMRYSPSFQDGSAQQRSNARTDAASAGKFRRR